MTKKELYEYHTELDNSNSLKTNTKKPLKQPNIKAPQKQGTTRFRMQRLINIIEKHAPETGRIKALAIVYHFMKQSIWIPRLETAQKMLRDEQILKYYREGWTYPRLATHFGISERRIRSIINKIFSG